MCNLWCYRNHSRRITVHEGLQVKLSKAPERELTGRGIRTSHGTQIFCSVNATNQQSLAIGRILPDCRTITSAFVTTSTLWVATSRERGFSNLQRKLVSLRETSINNIIYHTHTYTRRVIAFSYKRVLYLRAASTFAFITRCLIAIIAVSHPVTFARTCPDFRWTRV